MFKSVITGTGKYIPTEIKTNRDFTIHNFYGEDQQRIDTSPEILVEKFREITGIEERRYASPEMDNSDMGALAAAAAIADAGIDPEIIDQLIVAHNFGNVIKHTIQTDMVPSIAARIKQKLGIQSPQCIAYDLIFGCPGWIQGVIQAHAYFHAGMAKCCLIVGTETLSRVLDPYDRDSMIFSDGAGAAVLEFRDTGENGSGILSVSVQSHSNEEVDYLNLGKSFFPGSDSRIRYIKMKGRKVYNYALKHVPLAMKDCLDKAGVEITSLKKIFIHQANEKMDEAIVKALYKLYNINELPPFVMPMNIQKLGNSSVATVPTLYDLVLKKELDNHSVAEGDIVLFASVGAGMNINAICYRV